MRQVVTQKEKRVSWGIVLSLMGINTMALVKVMLGKNVQALSIAVMILSLILLFDFRSLRFIKKPQLSFLLVGLYSVVTIFLSLLRSLNGFPLSQMPFGLMYQGCYFLQIFLLWTRIDDLDTAFFNRSIFWFAGIVSILSAVLIIDNFQATGVMFFSGLGRDANGNSIITRASTGELAIVALFAMLTHTPETKMEKMCKICFTIMAAITLVLSNRRTTTATAIIVLILHFFYYRAQKNKIDTRSVVKKIVAAFCVMTVFVILNRNNPQIGKVISSAFASLNRAIGNYFGTASVIDMSADIRRNTMLNALDALSAETSLRKILLGHGYGTWWMDIPVLEAFWELGILGGISFIVVQILIPIRKIMDRQSDSALLLVRYLLILGQIQNFSSGVCYGISFPIALYFAFESKLRQKAMEARHIEGDQH